MPARVAAHVIIGTLNLITASGAAMLLLQGHEITGPTEQVGFWVTVVASTAGIVTAIIKWKSEKQRDERLQENAEKQHKWQEERRADEKQEQLDYRAWVKDQLLKNTELTRETKDLNVAALDAANHVHERIDALKQSVVLKDEMAVDTNETAHRIEEKL